MGKSGPKIQVAEYRMSVHFGICAGPVDQVSGLYVGEKELWSGALTEPGSVKVNKPDLFGGPSKEGGCIGTITLLPGDDEQVMPEYLAQKIGKTSDTSWAYRGISSVFFHENMQIDGVDLGTGSSRASGSVVFTGQPIAGDTVSIAGEVYTFRSSGPLGPRDVQIDPTTHQSTAQNLAVAVTGGTSPNPSCYATGDGISGTVTVYARQPGPAGNAFALADSATNTTVSGPFLTGGRFGGSATWISQWLSTVISAVGPKGFYWVANNPYLKTVWAKVSRSSKGLDTRYARLWRSPEEFDSNPAHIIFECLTDRVWGMGSPISAVDVKSFELAARTLYEENFGLSMLWSRSAQIESFCAEVLDHIEAALFVSPRTGLLTLKLIRADYDVSLLTVFNPRNSKVSNFSRKYWGETINEIIVTWTNPLNEKEETTSAQDLANVAIQGGVVSDGRNYYGVRTAALAQKLVQRDLRVSAYPIATCDLEVDRSAWNLLPGDVCKVVSPDDNIGEIVMRVGTIDYGKPGETVIRVSLAEDIFALTTAQFTNPPDSEWISPFEQPFPAAFTYIFTLPHYLAVQNIESATLATSPYPAVFAGVLAAQTGADTAFFELVGTSVDSVSNITREVLGDFTISSRSSLLDAIPAEAITLIPAFSVRTQGPGPVVGGLVFIGGPFLGEDAVEIAVINTISALGYEIFRGVLDTVPRAWPAATPVWFVSSNNVFADRDVRADTEVVDYWVLPTTSQGTLPLDQAPQQSVELTARPWLPLRPANVRVEGLAFVAVVDASSLATVTVTWANRNRLLEDTQILAWGVGSVTPEVGQTTVIEVFDLDGTLLTTHAGLTGVSFAVPVASFASSSIGRIVVTSERSGSRSLQGYGQVVAVQSGYGYRYGYNYGGL